MSKTEPRALDLGCVDLIASGYEWTCPNCESYNSEIEIPETVTCCECNTEFEVDQAEHAHK